MELWAVCWLLLLSETALSEAVENLTSCGFLVLHCQQPMRLLHAFRNARHHPDHQYNRCSVIRSNPRGWRGGPALCSPVY